MLTEPSTLLVPVNRVPVVAPLSSATLRVSSASLKSSLTGVTLMVTVAVLLSVMPSFTL